MEVLKDKKIEEVTITEICSCASLNRNTFYSHYSDVHQLLDELKSSYFEYFINEITEYRKKGEGVQKTITYFLKLIDASRDFFCVLFMDDCGPVFLRSLMNLCLEDLLQSVRSETESITREDISAFVIGGATNMIHEWFIDEKRVDPDTMGAKINYFIYRNVRC